MPRRRVTHEEVRLWREAMGEPSDPTPPVKAAPAAPPTFEALLDAPVAAVKPAVRARVKRPVAAVPGNLDPHDAKSIRRGRVTIDARIDLHGMTQTRAHETLVRFLQRSAAQRHRCVLVITGKGGRRTEDEDPYANFGTGVLRVQLPHWLEAPEVAPLVISSGPAAPQHGGDGARYVMLRRKRAR